MNLVENFVPDCQQKKDLISTCDERYLSSLLSLAPSRLAKFHAILQGVFQVSHEMQKLPIVASVAIAGVFGTCVTAGTILDRSDSKVAARVKPYMAGRTIG